MAGPGTQPTTVAKIDDRSARLARLHAIKPAKWRYPSQRALAPFTARLPRAEAYLKSRGRRSRRRLTQWPTCPTTWRSHHHGKLPCVAQERSYSNHLDNLIALITYLGLTRWRSRSANGLSRDLGLDERSITSTLDAYPGLFRKSRDVYSTDAGRQHSYTLHARYAQRRPRAIDPVAQVAPGTKNLAALSDPEPSQDGSGEELSADTLRALLDFVTDQAKAERETHQRNLGQMFVLGGVFIAAVASVIAAIIQATK